MSQLFSSLRFRLLLIVFLAALPTVGIIVYTSLEQTNRDLVRNLILLGLAISLALALAWFSSSQLVLSRINPLLNAARRLAAGDLSARTGLSYGLGELDQLARNFDDMAGELQHRAAELHFTNNILLIANQAATTPRQPFYTEGGSFFLNQITKFFAALPPGNLGEWRYACQRFGYESVALMPVRVGSRILGLIHVADYQEDMVPLSLVEVLEKVGMWLGQALKRLQAEERNRALSHELMRAQEQERQKISRELHDSVAQELAALKILLENLALKMPNIPGVAINLKISELLQGLQRSLSSVRNLSYGLRPPDLEHLGLVQAIQRYCEEITARTGLHIDFSAAGIESGHLTYETAITLYRIVQEGLTNVWRHAQADNVTLKLVASFPQIILRLEDDGQGFDVAGQEASMTRENQLGLVGMRERVALLGGEMDLQSEAQKGTKITIKIPWNSEGPSGPEEDSHR